MKKIFRLTATIIIFLISQLFSQSLESIMSIETYLSANGVHAGEKFKVVVVVTLKEPWHINSSAPIDPFVIPTKVNVVRSDNFTITRVTFPPHVMKKFNFSDEPLAVYDGKFAVIVEGKTAHKVITPVILRGNLSYQACNNELCLPPDSTSFFVNMPILLDTEIVQALHPELFPEKETTPEPKTSSEFDVGKTISQKGIILTFMLIFIGGLALNLTPCVYPLIPITIGYFGGQSSGKKGKRLTMAILYVLGIAIVNSTLGTLAALSGNLLGSFMTNPFVLVAIAAIFIGLSLSMFGIYEFRLPSFLVNMGGGTRTGHWGSLLMGLTMGIVTAPCIGPFVIGLLTYVASTGNPMLGFAMFFTLSLGLGIPFLFLAFFSSQIEKLPHSGEWMVGVRIIFGLVLVGMAIYFLKPLFPVTVRGFLLPVYLILSGVYLIVLNKSGKNAHVFVLIKKLLAVIAIFIGTWFAKPEGKASFAMNWQNFSENELTEAVSSGKPVLIDFYADWCIPCKEMDKYTFSDDDVIRLSEKFALFKVDMTANISKEVELLKVKYNVKGVPTILFIAGNGKEIRELRVIGFEEPEIFVKKMEKALSIPKHQMRL